MFFDTENCKSSLLCEIIVSVNFFDNGWISTKSLLSANYAWTKFYLYRNIKPVNWRSKIDCSVTINIGSKYRKSRIKAYPYTDLRGTSNRQILSLHVTAISSRSITTAYTRSYKHFTSRSIMMNIRISSPTRI